MTSRELLAWNLRSLRGRRGLSQETVAADTGLDRTYISEIERQKVNASLDVLDRLAAYLGVQAADLLKKPADGEAPPLIIRPGRRPKG